MLGVKVFFILIVICHTKNIRSSPTSGPEISKLKVVTLNHDNTTSENDANNYDLKIKGLIKNHVEYEFKPDSKCVRVEYDGVVVWEKKREDYPKKVSVNPCVNTLWVSYDLLDFATFKFEEGAWHFQKDLSQGGCKMYDEFVESVDQNEEASQSEVPSQTQPQKQDLGVTQTQELPPHPTDTPTPILETEVLTEKNQEEDLKLFELDLKVVQPTDQFDYNFVSERNDHIYKAKNGYKFSKIFKGEHLLLDYAGKHAHKVEINYNDGDIIIHSYCFCDNSFFLDILADPYPKEQPLSDGWDQHQTQPTSLTVISDSGLYSDHLKLLTQNDKAFEDPDTKFQIDDLTNLVNYTFNRKSRCTEVKYNERTLWRHDRDQHGDFYPTNVLLNTTTKFLLVESEGHYQYFFSYFDGSWKSVFGYKTRKPLSRSKLSLFTLNDRVLAIENDATQFETSETNESIKYTFKHEAKCIEVKYGHTPVWRYNIIEHGNDYPNSVTLNTHKNFLIVDAAGKYRHFYTYYDGGWKSVFGYKSQVPVLIHFRNLKLYTLDENENECENNTTQYDTTKTSTLLTVKFKAEARCVRVGYEDSTLWTYDASEHLGFYPTEILVSKKNNNLMVESSDKYRYLYSYRVDKWEPTPFGYRAKQSKMPPDGVDFSKLKVFTENEEGNEDENNSPNYDLEKNSNLFTVHFKQGVRCTRVGYDAMQIWKHDRDQHAGDYPTALLLNTSNSFVLIESENKYQYFYSYFGGKWKPVFGYKAKPMSNDLKSLEAPAFDKLKFFKVSENGTRVQSDPTDYEVEETAGLYTCKFKEGSKCTEVSYVEDPVWRYESKHQGSYPTTVVMNTNNGMVSVQSGQNFLYFYSFFNEKWSSVYGYNNNQGEPGSPPQFPVHFEDSGSPPPEFLSQSPDNGSDPGTPDRERTTESSNLRVSTPNYGGAIHSEAV